MKKPNSKREYLRQLLTAQPSLSFQEVAKICKGAGFAKLGSSELSDIRIELGIKTRKTKNQITFDDIKALQDLPARFGYSLKEIAELSTHIRDESEKFGGLDRFILSIETAIDLVARFKN